MAAAAAGIGLSYTLAASGSSPSTYYGVFWAAVLPALTALIVRIWWDVGSPTAELALLALLTFLPKWLRNPYGPLYHDEWAHIRAVSDIDSTGRLYADNPIVRVVGEFPGLHLFTLTLSQIGHLSTWHAALAVVALMHLSALLAVHTVLSRLGLPRRTAALGAAIYALNPSFWYFDTQFSYESVAITLFLWTVACGVAAGSAGSRTARWGWSGMGCVFAVACVLSHALSTLFLLVLLLVLVGATSLARRGRSGPWIALLLVTVATSVAWVSEVANRTLSYLKPYAGSAIEQLIRQLRGAGGGRQLYAASVQPSYEHAAGFLVQVVLLALMVLLLFRVWPLRRRWREHSEAVGLAAFGLAYFPAVLFILSPSGAEGGRRSWAFSYLGLSMLVALVLTPPPALTAASRRAPLWLRTSSLPLSAAFLCLLAMGNLSIGLNDSYRFPGPFIFGSDTRDVTPEVRELARTFRETYGPQRVITDRFTAQVFAVMADAHPASSSDTFPSYDFFLHPQGPSRQVLENAWAGGYRFLIVNEQLARLAPATQEAFDPFESPRDGPAASAEALRRYDEVPWATRVLVTDHYRVYALDLALAVRS